MSSFWGELGSRKLAAFKSIIGRENMLPQCRHGVPFMGPSQTYCSVSTPLYFRLTKVAFFSWIEVGGPCSAFG